MCVLDYDFMILDNAFLMHRPGIKTKSQAAPNRGIVGRQRLLINKHVVPELKHMYGVRNGC